MLTAWLAIISVMLLLLAVAVYLIMRQIGLMLVRLGPAGARSSDGDAPRLGEHLGYFITEALADATIDRPTLVLFASESCSICSEIRRAVESLRKAWRSAAGILFVYDEATPENDGRCELDRPGLRVFRSSSLRNRVGVTVVPFGVMLDERGLVLGRGLVNSTSHVESLLELAGGTAGG